MFTKLPLDIQEKIYKSLPVKDRVKLYIALPKDATKRYKHPRQEKGLGIIAKAISKKKVKKLSPEMKSYLANYVSQNDPTIKEIEEFIPDISDSLIMSRQNCNNKPNCDDLTSEKIDKLSNEDIKYILKTATPEVFDRISSHPYISQYKKEASASVLSLYDINYALFTFLYNIATANLTLFHYIVTLDMFDITALKKDLKFMLYKPELVTEVIFRHFTNSYSELEQYYIYCVEHLYLDSAEILELKLKTIENEELL